MPVSNLKAGIETFQQRRALLLSKLPPNSICLIPASQLKTRSRDTEFPFRQDSDFYYLTGFPEPDALLLLSNSEKYDGELSVLFCLAKDKLAEIWQGRRIGPDAAIDRYQLDEAYELEHVAEALVAFMDGHQHVVFAQGHDNDCDRLVFDTLEALRNAPKQSKVAPNSILDVRPLLHEMRLIKSTDEIAIMRDALTHTLHPADSGQ